MSAERCRYCGRTLKQTGIWDYKDTDELCKRCGDNNDWLQVSHSKSVRIAWKYRAITRRRCETCRHMFSAGSTKSGYANACNESGIKIWDDCSCPRWEAK